MLIDHRRRGAPLPVRLWFLRALAVGACALACGGRAADGPEDTGEGEVNAPVTPEPAEPMVWRPVRETCDDNPLLAGCPYARGGSGDEDSAGSGGAAGRSPATPVEAEPTAEPEEEEPLYIAAARNVLLANCGGCHGSVLTAAQAPGAINYIDDWDELIESGLIQQCSPARSRLVEVIRSGAMPPPSSGLPPVAEVDLGFVESAIELDCDR